VLQYFCVPYEYMIANVLIDLVFCLFYIFVVVAPGFHVVFFLLLIDWWLGRVSAKRPIFMPNGMLNLTHSQSVSIYVWCYLAHPACLSGRLCLVCFC